MIDNSADPDEMPHYAAYNAAFRLGLHCLPSTCLGVSGPQRVKGV